MKLRELMTKDVSSVSPKDSVQKAANLMKQRNVGCIPVCDENKNVKGVVTDRDIALRVIAEGRDPKNLDVSKVMSNDLTVGNAEMSADDAAKAMANSQVRRLPVVENDMLVGMVSVGDLATQNVTADEAGEALSKISEPSEPSL